MLLEMLTSGEGLHCDNMVFSFTAVSFGKWCLRRRLPPFSVPFGREFGRTGRTEGFFFLFSLIFYVLVFIVIIYINKNLYGI